MIELSGNKKDDAATSLPHQLRRMYQGLNAVSVPVPPNVKDTELQFNLETLNNIPVIATFWEWSEPNQKWQCYNVSALTMPKSLSDVVDHLNR